jgi:hypothetical protein
VPASTFGSRLEDREKPALLVQEESPRQSLEQNLKPIRWAARSERSHQLLSRSQSAEFSKSFGTPAFPAGLVSRLQALVMGSPVLKCTCSRLSEPARPVWMLRCLRSAQQRPTVYLSLRQKMTICCARNCASKFERYSPSCRVRL